MKVIQLYHPKLHAFLQENPFFELRIGEGNNRHDQSVSIHDSNGDIVELAEKTAYRNAIDATAYGRNDQQCLDVLEFLISEWT